MNCKACDYPLWNLTARKCPECGAPFKPSDFDFTINSVQFCCPHCRQPYYGTGERGHLVPSNFDCVTCGRRVDMDDMVLLPTEGVKEEQTKVDTMPWLERKSTSFIKAWWLTVKRGMTAPSALMRATPIGSPGISAVWFAVTVNVLAMLVGFGSLLIFGFVISGAFRGGGGRMGAAFGGGLLITFLGVTLLSGLMVFLWALSTHFLLSLGGPRAGSLSRTIHALGYSAGPMVLGAVPCLGVYISFVGWIWWLISATLMLKEAQRVSGGRAAFAVLTPPITIFVLVVAAYAIFVMSILPGVFGASGAMSRRTAMSQRYPQTSPEQQRTEVQTVLEALLRYGNEGAGQGPSHAAELVRLNFLSPTLLISSWSQSTMTSARIGNLTFDQFTTAGDKAQRDIVADATAALGPYGEPYRVGDYVFTDRGISFQDAGQPLWLLIAWPDQAVNPPPPGRVFVGTIQGTVTQYFLPLFTQELAAQNILRAQQGLPPIPHPSTIFQPGTVAAPQEPTPSDGPGEAEGQE